MYNIGDNHIKFIALSMDCFTCRINLNTNIYIYKIPEYLSEGLSQCKYNTSTFGATAAHCSALSILLSVPLNWGQAVRRLHAITITNPTTDKHLLPAHFTRCVPLESSAISHIMASEIVCTGQWCPWKVTVPSEPVLIAREGMTFPAWKQMMPLYISEANGGFAFGNLYE